MDDKYISTTTTAILNCRIVFLYIKRKKKLKIATIKSNLRSTKKTLFVQAPPLFELYATTTTNRTDYLCVYNSRIKILFQKFCVFITAAILINQTNWLMLGLVTFSHVNYAYEKTLISPRQIG